MKYLRWAILALCLLSLFIFVDSMTYKGLGSLAWFVLCIIVYIRPLSDVFPRFSWLKKGVMLRKELGILCATLGIAHTVGFFLFAEMSPISFLINESLWSFSNFLLWGLLAFIISLPLLITSNLASMKFLGKKWKMLQRLTYLFFIFTALHIAFIHPSTESFISAGFTVGIWAILWILAQKKIVLWKKKAE